MLAYRGGSKVSGANMTLRGNDSLVVDMSTSLSYVRIETGSGVQIKLDYNRVRITEVGTLVVGDALCNFIEITLIHLIQGNTSGSGTVTVIAQNIGVNTSTTVYESGNVPLQIKIGNATTGLLLFTSEAEKTIVTVTKIEVKISIG